MALSVYVGVHSALGGLSGGVIRLATEVFCAPPWVLGPAHPATHAFVAWSHGDGKHYRLDAEPGGAKCALWAGPGAGGGHPTALWRLVGSQVALDEAFEAAVTLIGAPYDFFELGAQVLPFIDRAGFVKHAIICTHLTTEVLQHAGGPARGLVEGLRSWYPEELGQALVRAARDGWLVRE